jgi:hypothetical protein
MSGPRFYLKDAVAAGSNFLSLQQDGSPPADATTSTGWTVGTTASGNYSQMAAGVERAAATFAATPWASAQPDNTLGDCWRSENSLEGVFAAANWLLRVPLIAVTSGGDQDVLIRYRMWKSINADGSNSVNIFEFTGGAPTGTITNLTTGAAQVAQSSPSMSSVVFQGEYLFLQMALETAGAGGAADRDVLIRVGSDASLLASEFSSPLPTAIMPTYQAQQVIRRYRAVGY